MGPGSPLGDGPFREGTRSVLLTLALYTTHFSPYRLLLLTGGAATRLLPEESEVSQSYVENGEYLDQLLD